MWCEMSVINIHEVLHLHNPIMARYNHITLRKTEVYRGTDRLTKISI
jgi:hypothetical protein